MVNGTSKVRYFRADLVYLFYLLVVSVSHSSVDATISHMIDFSHWYTLPEAPIHPAWKLSEKALTDGFKLGTVRRRVSFPSFRCFCLCLGGHFLGIFEEPILMKRIFNTESVEEAKELYAEQKVALAEKFKVRK
jgi:hypothetical protein